MGRSWRIRVREIREIHRGKVFRLTQETVTLPNRLTIELDVIRHPGAAAIVPLLDDSTVILIHQYRHAVGGAIWEIPAGTLSPGEEPLECAKRELREETGYDPGALRKLGEIVPVPAYSDERIHLFVATGLQEAGQRLEEDELLEVQALPLAETLAMVDRGEIVDAKTIVGLFMARAFLSP
jgi:ADP-ribose pyrophosphatase